MEQSGNSEAEFDPAGAARKGKEGYCSYPDTAVVDFAASVEANLGNVLRKAQLGNLLSYKRCCILLNHTYWSDANVGVSMLNRILSVYETMPGNLTALSILLTLFAPPWLPSVSCSLISFVMVETATNVWRASSSTT